MALPRGFPIFHLMTKAILPAFAVLMLTASAAEPLKVLYITGGCCHDYTAQKDIIPAGLEERANLKVTVFQDPNTTTSSRIKVYEDANWAAAYDVIIHNECYADTKDPEWTQRILKPHKEGKPGVVIHCAIATARTSGSNFAALPHTGTGHTIRMRCGMWMPRTR